MRVWLAEMVADGRVAFRVGRDENLLIADWPGIATLSVARDGQQPRFDAVDGAPNQILEKLRNGAVPALLRHLRGELTLHAAGVGDRRGGLAFVGDSGAGKSTLASAFVTQTTAWSLLSDDLLRIDGLHAVPTERTLWLDTAARDALGIADPSGARISAHPVQLRAICDLRYSESDEISVTRLRGVEAASVLTRSLVRFVLDESEVHRGDLDRLAHLARDVAIFRLCRPHGFQHTQAVIDHVQAVWGGLD